MNSTLFFCKSFKKGFKSLLFTLVLLPTFIKAQNSFKIPNKLEVNHLQPINYSAFQGNLKTAATCPTSPVGLAGQDTLNNTVTNGQVFACNSTPFYIYVPSVPGSISSPCVETEYTNFHNNLATNGTETFYEGGVKIACLGPSGCAFPIGNGTGIPGLPWGVSLSLLDPNQQHDFVFCRSGTITTTTITLLDCWTGAQLPSVPTSTVFSNTNPPNTSTCFTMTLPPNTDVGTAVYAISPTVTPGAFNDLHDGEAYVNTALLGPGAYKVTYSFTPSASSGCAMVTGTFSFSINPNINVTVNSPTVCPGATTTLTATASNGTAPYTYSWTPSIGLSATTGSVVTVTNPTVTTVYTVTVMDGGCTSSAISTVTVPTFTVNKAIICTGNSTTLIASNSSFSYNWSPSAGLNTTNNDTVIANPSTTTIYTVTATNNPSCPSLTLTVIDSVIVNLSPTITVLSPTVCSGTTATITAVGAATYTWSPLTNLTSSVTNDTVYISNPTTNLTYTAYGSASNGCTDSAVSNVIISNHLGILSGTPVVRCFGTPFLLSAIGASTYTWTSNDPTNLNFGGDTTWAVQSSVANVGTYTLAIYGESHSGTYCNGNDTVIVTINPTPTVTVAGNAAPAICSATSTTLTVNSSGPPITSYNWSPSAGLSITTQSATIASPTVTTLYTATGTDVFGCSSSANFTVSVIPVPSFTVNSTAFCIGNSDSLKVVPTTTASGAQTYSWTPATGLNTTTGTIVAVNPSVQGIYSYSIIGTNTISTSSVTCSSTATISVISLAASANSNSPVCKGAVIDLTSNTVSGASYSWTASNGYNSTVQNPIINNATSANDAVYSVTIKLGTCSSTSTTTVVVDNPAVSVTPTTATVCPNGAVTYTASGASTYTWSPSAQLSSANGNIVTAHPSSSITIYTVTGTDLANCIATTTTTLHVDSIVANMIASPETGDAPLDVHFINTSVNANNYVWSFGNGSSNFTTGNLNDTAKTNYPIQGTYTVVLMATGTTGTLTCTAYDTLVIVVTENYSLVIPNIFTPNGDAINDNFIVKGEGVSTFSMEIFDRWGLKMFSGSTINAMWDGKTTGGKDVPADTYFYMINATSSKTGVSQSYKGYLTLIR